MSKLRELRKADKKKQPTRNTKALVLATAGIVTVVAIMAFVALAPTKGGAQNGKPVVGEIRTFTEAGYPLELQDGKPVVRLFSTTWCPHCQWIKSTFDKVASEYAAQGKIVAYHWELDVQDDALTPQNENGIPESEMQVFTKFNPNKSIPTFVFGGKYVRIGNGYEAQNDLAAEEAEFRAVIEALLAETQGQ
jgi:thiol-disulfide isomerase/thioredoxin